MYDRTSPGRSTFGPIRRQLLTRSVCNQCVSQIARLLDANNTIIIITVIR